MIKANIAIINAAVTKFLSDVTDRDSRHGQMCIHVSDLHNVGLYTIVIFANYASSEDDSMIRKAA